MAALWRFGPTSAIMCSSSGSGFVIRSATDYSLDGQFFILRFSRSGGKILGGTEDDGIPLSVRGPLEEDCPQPLDLPPVPPRLGFVLSWCPSARGRDRRSLVYYS